MLNKRNILILILIGLSLFWFSDTFAATSYPTISTLSVLPDPSYLQISISAVGGTGGNRTLCSKESTFLYLEGPFSLYSPADIYIDSNFAGNINLVVNTPGQEGDCDFSQAIPTTWKISGDGSEIKNISNLSNGTHQLTFVYAPGTSIEVRKIISFSVAYGTVAVQSNTTTSWTITGPVNYSNPGGTSASYPNSPTGDYTILPASLSGCSLSTNATTQTLNAGQTITFDLNYSCGGTPTPPPPSTPFADIKANGGSGASDGPITIPYNTSATISWTSQNVSSCTVSPNGWTGTSGSQSTGNLTVSQTYTLSCDGGVATDSVVVNVSGAPVGCQGNCAKFISQNVSTTMTVSQSYPVSITMENTGTTTWTCCSPSSPPNGINSVDGYKLGSQNPENNSTWGKAREGVPTTVSVSPGQQVTFSFSITAPSTPGTYNFQWRMVQEFVQWFGDFTPNLLINVVTAPTPTLSVTLSATPSSGAAPLSSNLQATVGGTATGTINYSFWWNCLSTSNSVATASTACGSLPSPSLGTCSGNSVGYKCNAVSNASQSATSIYSVNSTAKVIVERDTASPAEARVSITVTNPPPNNPSNVTLTPSDFCVAPGVIVSWTYSDPSGSPQSAYQVQMTEFGKAFNKKNNVVDTGKVLSSSTSYFVAQSNLAFNKTYQARVKVWNSFDQESGWGNSGNWKTPQFPYPQTSFTWTANGIPENPSPPINKPVNFTDQTVFSDGNPNGRRWSWVFGDSGTSTQQNPSHTYLVEGSFYVTLTATDNSNQSCSLTRGPLYLQKPIPYWREIAPY